MVWKISNCAAWPEAVPLQAQPAPPARVADGTVRVTPTGVAFDALPPIDLVLGQTTLRNTAEYFAHESRDLVPRAEADVFLNGVDRLREDMDRLEARFAALEASLAPKAGNDR